MGGGHHRSVENESPRSPVLRSGGEKLQEEERIITMLGATIHETIRQRTSTRIVSPSCREPSSPKQHLGQIAGLRVRAIRPNLARRWRGSTSAGVVASVTNAIDDVPGGRGNNPTTAPPRAGKREVQIAAAAAPFATPLATGYGGRGAIWLGWLPASGRGHAVSGIAGRRVQQREEPEPHGQTPECRSRA